MKRVKLAVWLLAGSAGLAMAQPVTFKVGDRVLIGSTQDRGTIIAVGERLSTGGTYIKVHLDRSGTGNPQVGSTYDSALSHVQVIGSAPPAPGLAARSAPARPQPQPGPQQPQLDLGQQNRLSPGLCQQLIRANYPEGGDYTQTVSFLTFQMGAASAYEDIYANDHPAPYAHGHTVMAAPVHAKFTVLKRYQDPLADDELRTYDAQYKCYRSPATGWTIKMMSRLPGGERAQYIHKQ